MAKCNLDLHPTKHNWVEDVGGLPDYIHSVACSIVESGKTVSEAIPIAISRIKVWAATGTAETKAKAAAALAEWEAKRGKAKAKRSTDMDFETRGAKLTNYDQDKRQVAARAITYNLVDDHGTEFAPGCFAESLRAGNVKSVWSHDGKRPIGKVVDFHDTGEALDVIIQLADIDAVQDARMAHALLKDDIVNQFSVGFIRQADTNDGERITKADLVEISPVLRGSNPGTRTLAVRSATRAEATDLLNQVMLGEITAEDALSQLADVRESVTIPVTEYRSLMEKAGISEPKIDCCVDTTSEFRAIDDLLNEDWG